MRNLFRRITSLRYQDRFVVYSGKGSTERPSSPLHEDDHLAGDHGIVYQIAAARYAAKTWRRQSARALLRRPWVAIKENKLPEYLTVSFPPDRIVEVGRLLRLKKISRKGVNERHSRHTD